MKDFVNVRGLGDPMDKGRPSKIWASNMQV
jgi:hypothetical protein